MASILTIQALFFADGGLLALGCNIFNMGFFPCFVAFPLIYKRIAANSLERKRILAASMVASIIGLQLGALGVVTETFFSDISELAFKTFVLLMLPIHLAIGIVEGFVTASVVSFVTRNRPGVLQMAAEHSMRQTKLDQTRIDYTAHYGRLDGGFSLMVCFRKSRRP